MIKFIRWALTGLVLKWKTYSKCLLQYKTASLYLFLYNEVLLIKVIYKCVPLLLPRQVSRQDGVVEAFLISGVIITISSQFHRYPLRCVHMLHVRVCINEDLESFPGGVLTISVDMTDTHDTFSILSTG